MTEFVSDEVANYIREKYGPSLSGRLVGKFHPALPFRRFITDLLTNQDEQPSTIHAAVELGHAVFCLDNNIGKPEYVTSQARKLVTKQGLSEEELTILDQRVKSLYRGYKDVLAGIDTDLVPVDVFESRGQSLEAKTQRKEEQERVKAKDKLKRRLMFRFSWYSGLSDSQLRIININQSDGYKDDEVYKYSGPEIKTKIKNRSLTEDEYQKFTPVLKDQDTIVIDRTGVNTEIILQKFEQKSTHGRYLGGDATDEQEAAFRREVANLIDQGSASLSSILEQGLDPKLVHQKARNLISDFRIRKREEQRVAIKQVRDQYDLLVGKLPWKLGMD